MLGKRISLINPELTLTLAHAANEAYSIGNYPSKKPNPPSGYKYIAQWQGKNPSSIGGDVEPYGIIFQGATSATSGNYIFAFKGTASGWDAYEDLYFKHVPFKPHKNTAPSELKVEDGFFSVYSTPITEGHKDSMQDQLFDFIASLNPKKLIITGHSLGSALAELFTLDLYLSIPSFPFEIQHYNYACPRVGNIAFAKQYQQMESAKPEENKTIRVVNEKDEVPCLPFEKMGYEHGADYFLFSFNKKGAYKWWPHYGIRHSLYNYWQVLKKVMGDANQEFSGEVIGLNGIRLESTILASDQKVDVSSFAEELSQFSEIRKGETT